jgi:hypothetical protein
MRAWTLPIQDWKSYSAALRFISFGGGGEGLQNVPLENFDLLLGGLEPLLAKARELEPALMRGQRLLERKLAAFHARDDFFQLGERLLEAELGSG